jgi:hypothetical protein
MSQQVIAEVENEIKLIDSELKQRLEEESLHNPMLNRIQNLHREIHTKDKSKPNPKSFNELAKLTEQFYRVESLKQISDLQKNGKNLNFQDECFTRIPLNLDADAINDYLNKHPQLLDLLRIIELRALATHNGFCIVTSDLFTKITGKSSKTLQRQLILLREIGLVDYITATSSFKQGGFFTVKIIRANRIFIKYFACGFKSRCNHLLYAKFLKPEFLLVSQQFPVKWKTSKYSKHTPLELTWAYKIQANCYPDFSQYKRHQSKGTPAQKAEAIEMIGIEPYSTECLDRPSMYELFHGKAIFWSTRLQEIARSHMRWRVSIFREPFYGFGKGVILPKAIAWEFKQKRTHAIRHIPPAWVEASDKIVAGGVVQ